VIALAAVRATREAKVGGPNEPALEAIVGTPLDSERIGGEIFDGVSEAAIYPGELPSDPEAVFRETPRLKPDEIDYRFVRFRPPAPVRAGDGTLLPPPHIRLDRALQYLFGDRLI